MFLILPFGIYDERMCESSATPIGADGKTLASLALPFYEDLLCVVKADTTTRNIIDG